MIMSVDGPHSQVRALPKSHPGTSRCRSSCSSLRRQMETSQGRRLPLQVSIQRGSGGEWMRYTPTVTTAGRSSISRAGRRSNRPSANVQLQAYALAARASSLGAPAPPDLAVTFVYLGDGLDVVRQEVDDQWLGDTNARLGGLIENIRSQSFDPTPSAACTTCDFIRFCAEGKAFVEAGDEPSTI